MKSVVVKTQDEFDKEASEGNKIIVNSGFFVARGANYSPKTKPIAHDWDGGVKECGGGLHFCASPSEAKSFYPNADKFVACRIKPENISIHPDGLYPNKVKAKQVDLPCYEVDIFGDKV